MPLLLLETFVHRRHAAPALCTVPRICPTTGHKAKGYRRIVGRYQPDSSPIRIFVYPLQHNTRWLSSQSSVNPDLPAWCQGTVLLTGLDQMRTFTRPVPHPCLTHAGHKGSAIRPSAILAIATAVIWLWSGTGLSRGTLRSGRHPPEYGRTSSRRKLPSLLHQHQRH